MAGLARNALVELQGCVEEFQRIRGLAEGACSGPPDLSCHRWISGPGKCGVVSQVRRSAASIAANIAEGFGRKSTKELLQFLANANGSLEETRYFLFLSRDLGYLKDQEFQQMELDCSAVAQMIAALGRSLRSRLEGIHGSRSTSHGTR